MRALKANAIFGVCKQDSPPLGGFRMRPSPRRADGLALAIGRAVVSDPRSAVPQEQTFASERLHFR